MKLNEIADHPDSEHEKELEKTGFWGKAGAGCIILAKDTNRLLLPLRSSSVEQPNTWGTWGGAIDGGKSPEAAVKQEVKEEAGYDGNVQLIHLNTFEHESGFKYFNFLALIEEEFTPKLNWETEDFKWLEYGEWPSPLHFGLQFILDDPKAVSIIKRYASVA